MISKRRPAGCVSFDGDAISGHPFLNAPSQGKVTSTGFPAVHGGGRPRKKTRRDPLGNAEGSPPPLLPYHRGSLRSFGEGIEAVRLAFPEALELPDSGKFPRTWNSKRKRKQRSLLPPAPAHAPKISTSRRTRDVHRNLPFNRRVEGRGDEARRSVEQERPLDDRCLHLNEAPRRGR